MRFFNKKRTSEEGEKLEQLAKRYVSERKISPKYGQQIRSRLKHFVESTQLEHASDVDADALTRYVTVLEDSGLAAMTADGYRTSVMAVLRFGKVPILAADVKKPKVSGRNYGSWDVDEIRKLIEYVATVDSVLPNGVPRSVFWTAAIHAGFSTGLRLGDLWKLKVASIGKDGRLRVNQSKTGKPVEVFFYDKAMRAIVRHGKKMVLPWSESEETFRLEFRFLVRFSGIRHGTFKFLRRAAGECADAQGRGHELLGNTRRNYERAYRVRVTDGQPPSVPEL